MPEPSKHDRKKNKHPTTWLTSGRELPRFWHYTEEQPLTSPSFIAIKPDGVQVRTPQAVPQLLPLLMGVSQRGLVGDIISKFEKRGQVDTQSPSA